ncbi:translocation/assembly module TamB domain-containing protein [Pulveribacter sp.]|uniref:translocation/assembly module TamB domain-containing protein n=1 Tax=Pulveribacter sp. TaxID=2678893 RepID=UPI0028A27FCD|nr:translocation/assembly module TamB domain-containing protein [Pulveribacter sp.]
MPKHQSPDPYAAAVAPKPAPPRKSRWRFVRRGLALLLVLLVALLALAWWWTGSSTSLATALTRAAAYLPAGQQLQMKDVTGSVRTGGHVGWLRWQSETLAVEVNDATIGWQLAPLLSRQLKLGEVHAASVVLTPRGEPKEDEGPPEPLQQLVLPLQVDLPFRVDHLVWAGRGEPAQPLVIDDLAGRYRYAGDEHQLTIDHVTVAQGRYALQATLGALAPMPLAASLQGALRTAVPGSEETLHAQASANVSGNLAGRDALLAATAQLRGGPQEPGKDDSMQADVQARIAPWASQPLQQAQAALQAVDLALLWPQAPVTRLAGQAGVEPLEGGGWHISADLANGQPGPWDRQHLPLQSLRGEATFDGSTWSVPGAELQAGGGRVSLQGSFTPDSGTLQGQARVQGVDPAQLHTRLAPAPLTGTASASGSAQGGAVRFAADLRASAPRQRARGGNQPVPLLLQRLSAQGRWEGHSIELPELLLQAQGAQVRGSGLQIDTQALSARGRVQAEVPGATAQVDGQLAPASGGGTLTLRLANAARAQAWLAALPVPLAGFSLDGNATLDAQWRGGWRSAQQQLQTAGLLPASQQPEARAGDFTLQAQLQAPRLQLSRAPQPGSDAGPLAIELLRTSAALGGSLPRLTLALDGQVRPNPDQQAELHLRANGGHRAVSGAGGEWQAQVSELRVRASAKGQPGPWTLELDELVTVTVQQSPRLAVQAGAGAARLSGPQPGQATLRWQPLRYAQDAQGGMELTSQGELQGVPLAWADAFKTDGQGALARLGVSGDLLLAARWDVAATAAGLRAQASVRRTGGDLRIATGESLDAPAVTVVRSSGEGQGEGRPQTQSSASTAAGLREAVLELSAEGQALRARLAWDSERAGRVQAEGSTQLARSAEGGWLWPEDAPLAATVHAELPEVGVWSLLAPPGWRVQGTLSADARLSGSRAAPRWTGQLAADRFAVRSLLDGVDLQDGRLRATLQGQQLTITELQLKGGRGSRARIAGFSGNRTAAPADGGTLSGSGTVSWADAGEQAGASGIRMDVRAQARALQVLVRADRQVSVSGQLRAQLQDGQFTLRGDLTTDRATLILPEAGAPTLGDDVVVRSAALDRAAAEKAQKNAKAAQAREQGGVQAARTPDIALTLNLGDDFALQGHGITTRLTGQLDIRSSAATGGTPRVTGEVRTDQGRYRAWGQALDVESGLLRFNGPYDNPALDVLALRPNIAVRAGVQVTGSAQSPRVRLYSEPELPDAEKLSWVVLGRSAAAGGAEAALLQQAALAFLSGGGDKSGGGIAQRIGLDEIGFKGPGQGEGAASAALTFGKRLSRDLYVTYERSLSGVMGTLFIFYDLSKRLTLRGQTGEQSAVDLIYTVRYD